MPTKDTLDPASVFAGFMLDEAEIVLADFIATLSRFHRLRAKHLRGEHHDPDALNRFHPHMVSLMSEAEQAGVDEMARRKMAQWVGYAWESTIFECRGCKREVERRAAYVHRDTAVCFECAA